ncbi:MAG TPA: serine hydrolase domain-containing protein, partial [Xanthomonadales bacterium]|nr:serine hydrolase domain-containing protein [Xanthomonadales bacterium]
MSITALRPALLTLLLAFSSALAAAVTAGQATLADEFEDWFQLQVRSEDILGAAFAVVSRENIIRIGTAGYTDTSRKHEINADTAFRLASVSKTFAAELAAQMVQDGHLAWEDPITRYLPEFRVKGDASRIQIRHLLGHSTGLIAHAYDNLIEEGVPAAEIQHRLAELSFICKPGECYSYQNSIFSLIAPVVEKIAASSYANLVDQRIFKPLDMHTASVGYEAFLANSNRAEPHVMSNGQWKTVKVLPNYYRVAPAAGVNASVQDMGKWLMAQLGANPLVISPEILNTVVQPRVRTPGDLHRREWNRMLTDAHYGLGWRVYQLGDERIVYHSGWVSGYRADVAWSASHNL